AWTKSTHCNRVLALAAMAALFMLGMMAEAAAQTTNETTAEAPACPEGYTQTSKGCLKMRGRPPRVVHPQPARPQYQQQQQQQQKVAQPQPPQCTGAYEVRQGRQCVCARGYTRTGGVCVSAQVAQP